MARRKKHKQSLGSIQAVAKPPQNLTKMRIDARSLAAGGNVAAALELMASIVRMQEQPPARDYAQCTLYAWNLGRYRESRNYCEESLQKHGKTEQALNGLMLSCLKLRDYSSVLAAGQGLLELVGHADSVYAIMAYASVGVRDFEGAQRYGELSLTLKDAAAPAVPPQEFPRRKSFDPGKKARNIISFSLFGQAGRYLRGAVRNALLVHDLYPAWTCRFYLDASVPEDVTELLRELRAQIVVMPRPSSSFEGLGWRFQVWDDQDVDFCLIRDCDSVLSLFETHAVNAWLRSERWFHVMRAGYAHSDLILAGLWGGATGMLNDLYAGYVQSLTRSATAGADQGYLRKQVWPVVKQNALVHDRVHRLPGAEAFPNAEFWPGDGWHIGMNEAAGSPDKQDLLLQEYCKRCPSLGRARRVWHFSVGTLRS